MEDKPTEFSYAHCTALSAKLALECISYQFRKMSHNIYMCLHNSKKDLNATINNIFVCCLCLGKAFLGKKIIFKHLITDNHISMTRTVLYTNVHPHCIIGFGISISLL